MSTQDAQRSEVHTTTEDAASSPASAAAQQAEKDRIQKAILDTDLKPARDDSDVGGPVRISSDDVRPRKG